MIIQNLAASGGGGGRVSGQLGNKLRPWHMHVHVYACVCVYVCVYARVYARVYVCLQLISIFPDVLQRIG